MKHRLTRAADVDIEHILRDTLKLFGPRQLDIYAGYLSRAIEMAADNPQRASCIDRSEIRPGLRSIHLEIAARRRRSASHIVYFEVGTRSGKPEIVIVRVLHEKMEPKRHLIRALRETSSDD